MDNGQIARGALEEVFGKGNLEFVDQYFDRSYRGHDTLVGDFGIDGLKQQVQMYRSAFPDMTAKVDELVAAADKVLVRWTCLGTHKGSFLGKGPTGRRAKVQGISVLTFRNAKIIEDYTQWDALHLLQELGISPQIPELNAQAAAR
jgi:predicted ester cyclase